jgi:hypothetical protein
MHQIPNGNEPFDVRSFLAGLPQGERNQAGKLTEEAVQKFVAVRSAVDRQLKPRTGDGSYMNRIRGSFVFGWQDLGPDVARWLNAVCTDDWIKKLEGASSLSPGMLLDPRRGTDEIQWRFMENCKDTGDVLLARALQVQAEGKDKQALDHLAAALALSRNLRNKTAEVFYGAGWELEQTALVRLLNLRIDPTTPRDLRTYIWKWEKHPEFTQYALDVLSRHEELLPDPAGCIRANYIATRADLDNFLGPESHFRLSSIYWPVRLAVIDVPWERNRFEQLLNLLYSGLLPAVDQPFWVLPAAGAKDPRMRARSSDLVPAYWQVDQLTRNHMQKLIQEKPGPMLWYFTQRDILAMSATSLKDIRYWRIRLAADLYQGKEGKPPHQEGDLVPRFLKAWPVDPLSGKPFSIAPRLLRHG